MEYMNCTDYLEVLWNKNDFHTLISEQYWSGGVDTTDLFLFMKACAISDGVYLTDVDTWNYDKELYECYKNSDDKGLS